MAAPKSELEARVAALEAQMSKLLSNSAIQAYMAFDAEQAQMREHGAREMAPIIAARDAAERELQDANVIWISAKVAPNARGLTREDGIAYATWRDSEDGNREQRLGAPPHDGRIESRKDAWLARLARCPDLAALVDAGTIVVQELTRDEAIDLERRARAEERR